MSDILNVISCFFFSFYKFLSYKQIHRLNFSFKLWCFPLTDLLRETQHVYAMSRSSVHSSSDVHNRLLSFVTPKMLLNQHSITQSNIVRCLIYVLHTEIFACGWQLFSAVQMDQFLLK